MTFIENILEQFRRMAELWGEFEAIGGGFNVTLDYLKDKEKRKPIGNKIREFAVCIDEILEIFKTNNL